MSFSNNKNKPNYFSSEEGKEAAMYKLWIAWKSEYVGKWGGKPTRVWFSYNKRKNNGLDWLIDYAKSIRIEFKVAKIYDNKTGKELYNIPGLDVEALQATQNID